MPGLATFHSYFSPSIPWSRKIEAFLRPSSLLTPHCGCPEISIVQIITCVPTQDNRVPNRWNSTQTVLFHGVCAEIYIAGRFCRHDVVKKTQQVLYDETFRAIHGKSMNYFLHVNGNEDWISVDRPKTATILSSDTQDQEWVNEGPYSSESVLEFPSRDLGSSITSSARVILPGSSTLDYSATFDPASPTSIGIQPSRFQFLRMETNIHVL